MWKSLLHTKTKTKKAIFIIRIRDLWGSLWLLSPSPTPVSCHFLKPVYFLVKCVYTNEIYCLFFVAWKSKIAIRIRGLANEKFTNRTNISTTSETVSYSSHSNSNSLTNIKKAIFIIRIRGFAGWASQQFTTSRPWIVSLQSTTTTNRDRLWRYCQTSLRLKILHLLADVRHVAIFVNSSFSRLHCCRELCCCSPPPPLAETDCLFVGSQLQVRFCWKSTWFWFRWKSTSTLILLEVNFKIDFGVIVNFKFTSFMRKSVLWAAYRDFCKSPLILSLFEHESWVQFC